MYVLESIAKIEAKFAYHVSSEYPQNLNELKLLMAYTKKNTNENYELSASKIGPGPVMDMK